MVILNELHADKVESARQAHGVAEKSRTSPAGPYQLTVQDTGRLDSNVEHHCSASIGVVLFLNHEASQVDMLKWADTAMYAAKDAGRNSVRIYQADV